MNEPATRTRVPALSILWVEPSHILAERLVRLAVSRPGIVTTVATSLDDALAKLRDWKFDVVAVDVVDPARRADLDSLRVLRSAAPESKLVALTADLEPETSEACRTLGADELVPRDGALGDLLWVLAKDPSRVGVR
jgi:CheY-like chemotaxis protein